MGRGASAMSEIQKIPYDNKAGRVESGPVQFGDDWPGYFLRGDNAFGLAMAIQALQINPYDVIMAMQVREFGKDLMSCIQGVEVGPLVEPADTAALKPASATSEGSSPSGPTTDLQKWQEMQETDEEKNIAVGQKRIIFIDGIGDIEGTITKFDDLGCNFDSEAGKDLWMGWDMPGMNAVGCIVNGAYHKKIMAQEEQEAINARPAVNV